MTLATILYPPPTDHGWDEWMLANDLHHKALIDAINASRGTNLTMPQPIWPVEIGSEEQMRVWSRVHLDLHNDINAALGIPGQDIGSPNFKDKRALDGWTYIHFTMHQSSAQLAGVAI